METLLDSKPLSKQMKEYVEIYPMGPVSDVIRGWIAEAKALENSSSVSVADAGGDVLRLLRTYTVKEIRFKEKGYCGTCEGYEVIVAQMADEGGDEWEVCADCLKQFREQAAKFAEESILKAAAALESSTQTAGKAGDGEDSGAKAEPSGGAHRKEILTERTTKVNEAKPEVSASSPSPRPEPTQTQEHFEAASDADTEDTRAFLTKMGLMETQPHFWEFPPNWKPTQTQEDVRREIEALKIDHTQAPDREVRVHNRAIDNVLALLDKKATEGETLEASTGDET